MTGRYLRKRALLVALRRATHPALRRWLHAGVLRLDRSRVTRSGAGHRFEAWGAALSRVEVTMVGADHTVTIADGAILQGCRIVMTGRGHRLEIGARCHLVGVHFVFEDEGGVIRLGDRTTIEGGHLAAVEPGRAITLGEDCMLSEGVDLRTSDSHGLLDAATGRRLNPAGDIRLGDHVWLGSHATVLKGVSIGDHAVVGARSVVTSDVPSGCVAAGVPARVLRDGVTWTRERPAT